MGPSLRNPYWRAFTPSAGDREPSVYRLPLGQLQAPEWYSGRVCQLAWTWAGTGKASPRSAESRVHSTCQSFAAGSGLASSCSGVVAPPPGLIPRRRRSSSRARCRGHGPLAHIETAPAARKGRRPGHSAGLEQWEAHPTPAVWACCGPIHVRSARGGSGPGGAAGAEVACSIESDSIARKHRRECVSSGRSETAFSVTGRIASERHFGFRGGRLTALRASGGDAIIPGL